MNNTNSRTYEYPYLALVRPDDHTLDPRTDAAEAAWFSIHDLPALAFDHDEIFQKAFARLCSKIRYAPLAFELLPKKFTLSQVQRLYELLLKTTFDKRNFRKRLLALGLLIESDEFEQNVAHRAARLYTFDEKAFESSENTHSFWL